MSSWTEAAGINNDNCGVFYMDPATMGQNSGSDPVVLAQLTTDGVAGFTTVRLTLTLTAEQENVYSLFGEPGATIRMPPCG